MNWVQENTQPSSIFLVITGDNNIWKDEVSEWFPTITKRVSAATVQGSEWLPGDVELHQEQYMYLQNCATQNLDCVNSWAGENQIDFDYIYLHKLKDDLGNSFNCCYPLRNAIESSTDFRLIFDGPGATIFAQLH